MLHCALPGMIMITDSMFFFTPSLRENIHAKKRFYKPKCSREVSIYGRPPEGSPELCDCEVEEDFTIRPRRRQEWDRTGPVCSLLKTRPLYSGKSWLRWNLHEPDPLPRRLVTTADRNSAPPLPVVSLVLHHASPRPQTAYIEFVTVIVSWEHVCSW